MIVSLFSLGDFFMKFSLHILFVLCIVSAHLFAALPASFSQLPQPTVLPQPNNLIQSSDQLGQNKLARYGAWASLGIVSLMSAYITYKTGVQCVDSLMRYAPFLDAYRADAAPIMGLMATLPLSSVALMKLGPLAWYFFYIIYAGERMSPVLARNALRDVQVYVQHLHIIKAIQQDLLAIIEQINEAATVTVSTANVQLPLEIPASLKKKSKGMVIDPEILANLQEAIAHDEEYVYVILQQLQKFLTEEELAQFEQELQIKSATVVYAIAYELQDQAQGIIEVLKMSEGQDMGDDAAILNHLVKDLIVYWQSYTQSLADGIDASVRFCNDVHLVEKMIVNWLDRSLLCI